MCLELSKEQRKNKIPLVAKTDLVVYKFLKKTTVHRFSYNDMRGEIIETLVTPYRQTMVDIGSTYESEFTFNCDGDVEMALHSLKSLKSIKKLLKKSAINWLVCRCVIPKGSKYYQGKFNTMVSYASDTLKYLELI